MNFRHSFRVKFLIVLVTMFAAATGVLYYLNSRIARHDLEHRRQRQEAIVGGLSLGTYSLTSTERMLDLRGDQPSSAEFDERLDNILLIDHDWRVYDSLNQELLPDDGEDYLKLSDVKNLPPLSNALQLGSDREKFPNAVEDAPRTENGEAYALPLETVRGRWYVMVVLKPEEREPFFHSAQPLTYMLLILLAASLLAMMLAWRFTRPIAGLSAAARRIAEGDLTTRVRDFNKRDEMGELVMNFNEMAAQIERRQEIENKLRQTEKMAVLGRLVSAIAHEIRNPLNYINLTLDHLRAKFAPAGEKQQETFNGLTAQLKTEVSRIDRQITDLLRFSRPLVLDVQPTGIGAIIENSMRLVERQAEEQSVAVTVVEDGVVPQISGDSEYLRSVFSNLFINAVQAMPDGGKLNVSIVLEDDFVVVHVADTGNGIPPENLGRVFEPYFSTKEAGTGIGLAIVKKIVEDHRGTIDVDSQPRSGTVFTVKLPAVAFPKSQANDIQ